MPLDLNHVERFFTRLHIRDRDYGTFVPFTLRPQQQEVFQMAKDHLARRRRLFVIFLKARRLGISTIATGIGQAHCIAHPGSMARCIAQNAKVASANFDMASSFFKDCRDLYPGAAKPTKSILTWPHSDGPDSTFEHHTAATVHGQRGLTSSMLHLTEAAFYPYENVFTSLMNTLSMDKNNICLVETTANGMEGPGEAYYQYWEGAMSGENEFLPIFLPWWDDPAYVLPEELAMDAPRDEYEKFLMNGIKHWKTGKRVRLGKDRVAWFRETLATKCENVIEKWRAEMPSCLVAETRVSTDIGIVRIADAEKATRTETGIVHKWGPQPRSLIFRLATTRGREIEGTFDHPVMTAEGEWVWLGRLTKGTKIKLSPPMFSESVYKHTWHPVPGIDASVTINEDWALLLGYFMGDGCWYHGAIDIACDAKDQDTVEECGRLCDKIIGYHTLKHISRVQGQKGCTVVKTGGGGKGRMNPMSVLHAFRELGLLDTAPKKSWDIRRVCVPECIWRSPKYIVRAFLSALFECDGTASGGRVAFATVHLDFAQDLQLLLLGFGINCTIIDTLKKAGTGKQYKGYKLVFNAVEGYRFVREIGFRSARKKAIPVLPPIRNLTLYEFSYELFDEVSSVDFYGEDITYDFNIAGVHCFGANGILTHNTPEEAFVATGNPAFTIEEMQFAENAVVKVPPFRGRCVLTPDQKHAELQKGTDGPLVVYETPQKGAHYFAGVDSARGEENTTAPGDYAAIVVWNGETGHLAARYMSRVSPEQLAPIAAAIGYYFNGAMLNVELNNIGYVTMRELRDRLYYPNQYIWKGRDDRVDRSKTGVAYGFETSDRYRKMMFSMFRTSLYKKEVVPKDRVFVDQMKRAKMEMGWRWNVAVGNDDVLMAGFLGWISREQNHPTPCQSRAGKNILLTKEELENAGFEPTRQMPQWLKDPTLTVNGMVMTTGNDHLKKIEMFSKQKRKAQRLEWI